MNVTEYKTPYFSFQVHEHHIVATDYDFVRISEKELHFLTVIANKHFTGPFGVVEVRDKNVSLDTQLQAKVKEVLPNFSAYALVTDSEQTHKSLEKEKSFIGYENFKLCSNINEATDWVNLVLTKN